VDRSASDGCTTFSRGNILEEPATHRFTQKFSFGGGGGEADSDAICNLCLILKTVL
jgi:hypothetical protein